jgi:hypothetical protein
MSYEQITVENHNELKITEDNKVKLLSCTNSQTAINGFKEEEKVCKDLSKEPIKHAFASMCGNNYNECNKVTGIYKTDIQSKDGKLKAQVKKFKNGQFQQIDRHWISVLIEHIPELLEVSQILKELIEYPLLQNGTHVDKRHPLKKLCTSYYSQETLDNLLSVLNKHKRKILTFAFLGINKEMQPEYLFGVEYINNTRSKLVVFKINEIICYLESLEFKISPRKTAILLGDNGTLSLQRKGGDSGKKSSNQLQIKLIVSRLFDKVPNLQYNL